ncbi:uncharacterized protein RAG0_04159 [Rhynchosporium agropyri]|uniref:L-tryptophan decarboxylase PsiD-like domain-containing protein n=1 Tax=Rhynchosporium agropyri TaxID=914238 RepID=A0A1E1K7P9_9HELO|nr:uncharacterized protein RAG0_04159 [Rhynchosporium agropyri]
MLVIAGPFSQVIIAFAKFIHDDESLRRGLEIAIADSWKFKFAYDKLHARNFQHFLQLMNEVLRQPPVWTSSQDGNVGCPLSSLFQPIMNTTAGWAVFSRTDFNEHLRFILQSWAYYLQTVDSRWCLGGGNGWCDAQNLKFLEDEAQPDGGGKGFVEIFLCPDPSDKSTLGFRSWDDFFTRQFAPGIRPRAGGMAVDLHQAVLHPCEASTYRLTSGVRLSDEFWLKGQPYSVVDMLDQHWSSSLFRNGTVYQAYLSALSYHRWHAPVSGTVVSVKHIPGSYFAQAPAYTRPGIPGESSQHLLPVDDTPPNRSQAYLASVATRLLILFAADCHEIGMVAFLAIGMVEVSSCQSLVTEGQHVVAGDEIGMFHYGGSSYCLLFQPSFDAGHLKLGKTGGNNPVRSLLALPNHKG